MVNPPEVWDMVASEWEMACPDCATGDSLDVEATICVRLVLDGTDADGARSGDHEWDDDSVCSCGCGWAGTVRAARAYFSENTTDENAI